MMTLTFIERLTRRRIYVRLLGKRVSALNAADSWLRGQGVACVRVVA